MRKRALLTLDLHGFKHDEVEPEIINFIYQYQHLLPLIIICGNSNKMIEIATKALTYQIFHTHLQGLGLSELRELTDFNNFCKFFLN